MDFTEWKKKHCIIKADFRNPWMGLNGNICKKPVYWCRLHEVWLSEEDVAKKNCLTKLTYDMIAHHKCSNIEKRTANPFLKGES